MTPKEKAVELVNKFYNTIYLDLDYEQSKYAALIAVDEILETTKVKWATQRKLPNGEWRLWKGVSYKNYWKLVKQEIEKI
jgi:hypothetical protein